MRRKRQEGRRGKVKKKNSRKRRTDEDREIRGGGEMELEDKKEGYRRRRDKYKAG